MSTDYWVEIRRDDRLLGAGFLLTKRYVLTALHCLKDVSPGDDNVRIFFPGAADQGVPARVGERSHEADLALVEVLERLPLEVPPLADCCTAGDRWHGPYRPRHSDPYLGGTVACESVKYQCESGSVIEALQLAVREDFGDYSGYSGGPVERAVLGTQDSTDNAGVVGILIEQYPDRRNAERASRTLFAATIAEVVRRFDSFDFGHLINLVHPEPVTKPTVAASNPTVRSKVETDIDSAEQKLQALQKWGETGLLDASQVATYKARVAENLIDGSRPE